MLLLQLTNKILVIIATFLALNTWQSLYQANRHLREIVKTSWCIGKCHKRIGIRAHLVNCSKVQFYNGLELDDVSTH